MNTPRSPRPSRAALSTYIACALLLLAGCEREAVHLPVTSNTGAPSTPTSSKSTPSTTPSHAGEQEVVPFVAPALPGIESADRALTEALRKETARKGKDYKPRTHHLEDDGAPIYVNRLIREVSPYLLQHAHNPVNWYPWGEEAFAHARLLDRPVLLSVGYSTCHWCHVMERESFEDKEIAAYMNANFIAIKVDREQRPDIDDVYMKAVNLLVGRGGWPMTVVMTAEKEPFFGGTYFPPRDGVRGAHKGFLTILKELSARYEKDREEVVAEAAEISQKMARQARPTPSGGVPTGQALRSAAVMLTRSYDPVNGGFSRRPKFPTPVNLEFLLRYHHRTRDAGALKMVERTLEAMMRGGIYDHVAGGFHRYSVDSQWLIPHFEKMLYDNAQLATVYLLASQATGREDFAEVARDILRYVNVEMTDERGAFYSATDADSMTPAGHLEEGYFFSWTRPDLIALLGSEDASLVAERFGVTDRGNFEGRTVLHIAKPLDALASAHGVPEDEIEARLGAARLKMYSARLKRPAPLRDDKILVSWNGLMISAHAQAATILAQPQYATRARRAVGFILSEMRDKKGRLKRSYKDGKTTDSAFLDDYAFLIQGLLDLFEATGDPVLLDEALALQKVQDTLYWDEAHGGYFMTASDQEALIVREKPAYDGAEPSGNSVAAMNLVRLLELTQDEAFRGRADKLFAHFSRRLMGRGIGSTRMLGALDFYLDTTLEVIIVSAPDAPKSGPLYDVLRTTYLPNKVFIPSQDGEMNRAQAVRVPFLEGKTSRKSAPRAFVCEQGRCELPTQDPKVFAKQLDKREPLIKGQALPPLDVAE